MQRVAAAFERDMDDLMGVLQLTQDTFELARQDAKRFRSKHPVAQAALTVRDRARNLPRSAMALPYEGLFLSACAQFELAVRDTIETFVEGARVKVSEYAALPEPMRRAHMRGIAAILRNPEWDVYKHLAVDDVVVTLAGCVKQAAGAPYVMVPEALSHNEHNFKCKVISEHMKNLGIEGFWKKVGSGGNLQHLFNVKDDTFASRLAMERLDSLMDRRNQIIHRGKGFPLSSNTDVREAALFFRAVVSDGCTVLAEALAAL